MTAISQDSESHFASSIQSLVGDIEAAFPAQKLDSISQILRIIGMDYEAGQVAEVLCGKYWNDVPAAAFAKLDSTHIRIALAPRGMACYLPTFMTHILATRGFGWFEELLLPVGVGLEDVVEQFSGSMLEEPENNFRERYRERVVYAKEHLLPCQRECVARYIEIAEGYGVKNPTPEFAALLKKYADFWRE